MDAADQTEQPLFQIKVTTCNFTKGAKDLGSYSFVMSVRQSTTIAEIRARIIKQTGGPQDNYTLTAMRSPLEDQYTLEHYHIVQDTTVYMTLRLKGGMNPPKKNKFDPTPQRQAWAGSYTSTVLPTPYNGQRLDAIEHAYGHLRTMTQLTNVSQGDKLPLQTIYLGKPNTLERKSDGTLAATTQNWKELQSIFKQRLQECEQFEDPTKAIEDGDTTIFNVVRARIVPFCRYKEGELTPTDNNAEDNPNKNDQENTATCANIQCEFTLDCQGRNNDSDINNMNGKSSTSNSDTKVKVHENARQRLMTTRSMSKMQEEDVQGEPAHPRQHVSCEHKHFNSSGRNK